MPSLINAFDPQEPSPDRPSASLLNRAPAPSIEAAVAPTAEAATFNANAAADWIAQQRAISQQRGLWANGAPTAAGARDAGMQMAGALALATTGPVERPAGGFVAYHGSPHDFDAFDASKIGTGEGAQAYGHGLYVADGEGVARSYRDNLSGQMAPADYAAYTAAHTHAMDTQQEITGLQDLMTFHSINKGQPLHPGWGELGVEPHPDVAPIYQPKIDRLSAERDASMAEAERIMMTSQRNPGHMYEVHVAADPAHFLDWDKPLSEQHPVVQQALEPIIAEAAKTGRAATDMGYADMSKLDNPTGEQLQGILGAYPDRNAALLRDAGIPGIRYADAGSRPFVGGSGAGAEGTKNTVVFDPSIMRILRKYAIPAAMLSGTGHGLALGGPDTDTAQ